MLDDLRNSAGNPFLGQDKDEEEKQSQQQKNSFLGMNAPQRFIVSIFFFFMVLIIGVFMLILFQKVYF